MAQVIGESSPKIEFPKTTTLTPQDLMATILHTFGIDQRIQVMSNQGRLTYLVEEGKPIPELV